MGNQLWLLTRLPSKTMTLIGGSPPVEQKRHPCSLPLSKPPAFRLRSPDSPTSMRTVISFAASLTEPAGSDPPLRRSNLRALLACHPLNRLRQPPMPRHQHNLGMRKPQAPRFNPRLSISPKPYGASATPTPCVTFPTSRAPRRN